MLKINGTLPTVINIITNKYFTLFLIFKISYLYSGEITYVSSVTFNGNYSIDRKELLNIIQLKPQKIFTRTLFTSKKLNKDIITIKAFYKSKGFLEIEIIPNDWDDFWEKAHVSYDFIFSRDLKTIEWRFVNHPNKYRFYILKQHNELIGYLTYRILHEKGITNLVIADFLVLKGREEYLKSLLFRVLKDSIEHNVTKINIWCPQDSPYFKILKDFGFMRGSNVPVICYQNDFASEIQDSCHKWHFTISDSDNI